MLRGAAIFVFAFAFEPAAVARSLSFSAPLGCPSEADFALAVATSLGEPMPASDQPIRVQIEAGTGRFVVRVVTLDGERTLDGDTCQAVADAAALIVALAIQPGEPRVLESQPETAGGAVYEPPFARLRARVSGGADTGDLPGLAAGFQLALALELAFQRAEILATHLVGRRAELPSGAAGDLELWTVGGRGCAWFWCLGLEAGFMPGQGTNVGQEKPGTAWWAAGTAGLQGAWKLSDLLGIHASLEVIFPLTRPMFTVAGANLFRPPAASARAFFGLEYAIW